MNKSKMYLFRIITICTVLLISFSLISCRNSTDNQRVIEHYGYNQLICSIDSRDGDIGSITYINYKNNKCYVSAVYEKINDSNEVAETYTVVYVIGSNAEIESSIKIDGIQTPYCMLGENFAYYTHSNTIVVYSPYSGDVVKVYEFGSERQISTMAECDNGLLVFSSNQIVLIDSNWTETNVIQLDQDIFYSENTLISRNGKLYLVAYSNMDMSYDYYELDLSNETCLLKTNSKTFTDNPFQCFGGYVIDNTGEYLIDLDNECLTLIADWNDINIRPESKALSMQPQFYSFDDLHFAKTYTYADGSFEILLFEYDASIDYSDREIIVVGGYGVKEDLAIRWSQYQFNTTNTEYRIQLDDYSEIFGYMTNEEAEIQTVELIQYFNQGNCPDIYYGEQFDYNYFGVNGMVLDLCEYIERDNLIGNGIISTNIYNAIKYRDNCYQIFPSYTMNGYFGLASDFDSNYVSYDELMRVAQDRVLFGATYSTDLFESSYMNNLIEMYENNQFDLETLTAILTFSINEGTNPNGGYYELNNLDSIVNEDYVLAKGTISSFSGFVLDENSVGERIRFVGYPSVDGSIHLINGHGLVAISSDTDYADVCWEFIKGMFSDDIQKVITVNQTIPVNSNVLDLYFEYLSDPSCIPEEEYILKSGVVGTINLLNRYNCMITDQLIDDYRNTIATADTLLMFDFELRNIAYQEISSYYVDSKPVEQIADTLFDRLELYLSENYT